MLISRERGYYSGTLDEVFCHFPSRMFLFRLHWKPSKSHLDCKRITPWSFVSVEDILLGSPLVHVATLAKHQPAEIVTEDHIVPFSLLKAGYLLVL